MCQINKKATSRHGAQRCKLALRGYTCALGEFQLLVRARDWIKPSIEAQSPYVSFVRYLPSDDIQRATVSSKGEGVLEAYDRLPLLTENVLSSKPIRSTFVK